MSPWSPVSPVWEHLTRCLFWKTKAGKPQPAAGGGKALMGQSLPTLGVALPGEHSTCTQPPGCPRWGQTQRPRAPPPAALCLLELLPRTSRASLSHMVSFAAASESGVGGSPSTPPPVLATRPCGECRRRQRGCGLGDRGAVLLGPTLLGLGSRTSAEREACGRGPFIL